MKLAVNPNVDPVAPITWNRMRAPNNIDTETSVLLKSCLLTVFQKAHSWTSLRLALENKGLDVGFRDARLVLIDRASGDKICSCRRVGISFRELVLRLGRPYIKAVNALDGEILH